MGESKILNIFFLCALLIFSFQELYGQVTLTVTPTPAGAAWNNTANWSGGNIADNINENVDFSGNNKGEVYVPTFANYTVGNVDMLQGNELTIRTFASLTLGTGTLLPTPSITDKRDLTTDNNSIINVNGVLIIYGDLIVKNNLELNVTGSLNIVGNVILQNNASIDVSGLVTISGDLQGGENTDVNVDGILFVDGNIEVGNNSDLTGSGTVINNGTCTDNDSGSFCNSGPLPVELISFNARAEGEQVNIYWVTASELNNDFFTLEKSQNGLDYKVLDYIEGNGTKHTETNYDYSDSNPYLGISYYRLSQTDFDGTSEIFPAVAVVYLPEEFSFSVSPNPVAGQFIRLKAYGKKKNELLSLKIIDINGQEVETARLTSDDFGTIDVSYEIKNQLNKGVYVVELISTFGKETYKIVKE